MTRLDRDHYFMAIALVVAQRAPCLKRKVGCVITINNRTLSTGYNGPPSQYPHCVSCAREGVQTGSPYYSCPAIHAEANAIVMALKNYHDLSDAVMYCTLKPCFECLKLAMNCGIKQVIYNDEIYTGDVPLYTEMTETLSIELIKLTTI